MPSTAAPSRMPGKREFVVLMAALMASNALAIDAMLPALPAIGEALGVAEDNRRQLVITFYLLGFGAAQLVYGPLADRFGRKPLLIGCMVLYALLRGACRASPASFDLLLAARFAAGRGGGGDAGAGRRDRARPLPGPAMAQIMSLAMIIFMIVPVLAPSFGQGVLADRQLAAHLHRARRLRAGAGALGLAAAARDAGRGGRGGRCRPAHIGRAVAETLTEPRLDRQHRSPRRWPSAACSRFIGSIQQIVFDVFGRPELIGLVFACIAGPMAVTSYANSRLVMRLGPRRLLLGALDRLHPRSPRSISAWC